MLLDLLLAYLLVGLALMGLLELLSGLLKLRYLSLRAALEGLVAAAKPPKGFLAHVLVERALADPAVDPLSGGVRKEDEPVHPAGRVTRIEPAAFVTGVRSALARTDVKLLVDGLSVRPDAVQEEVRQEVSSFGDRVASSVSAGFDRAMAAAGERYARTMRQLAGVLGVAAAVLVVLPFAALDLRLVPVLAVGVFLVPISAGAWYGLLAGPMRLRSPTPPAARVGSSRERSSGKGGGRSGGGGGGRSSRSGPASSSDDSEGGGSSSGGGRSSGGGQRRRGRRSSGRRGGRGGAKSSGGGSGGGGSPSSGGE